MSVVPVPFRFKSIETPIKCSRNLVKVYPQQGSISYTHSGTNKIIFRLPNTKSTLIDMKRSMLSFDLQLGTVSGFQPVLGSNTGALDFTSASVLDIVDSQIVVPQAWYDAVETGDAVVYAQGASGAQANLTDGTTYYVIKSGTINKIALALSYLHALDKIKINLTATATGGTAHTLTTTNPNHASPHLNNAMSWCDRIVIRVGNQVVSDVQSDNLIKAIIDEMTVQPEAKDGLRSILTGEGSTEAKRVAIYSSRISSSGDKKRFAVPIDMLIDESLMPVGYVNYAFEITFHLANPLDCVKIDSTALDTATTTDYTIDNIQWLVEEVMPLDSAYISTLSTQLAAGIDIPFCTYEHSVHSITSGSGTRSIEIPTRNRSTKSIIWVARNTSDLQKLNKDTLKIYNYNNMSELHYRLNSQLYPQQPIDCTNGATENFLELAKNFDLVSTYGGVMKRNTTNNINSTNYTETKFINSFGFNSHPNTTFISGKNLTSASSSLVIKMGCNPSATQQLDVFIEYDAILTLTTTKVDLKR